MSDINDSPVIDIEYLPSASNASVEGWPYPRHPGIVDQVVECAARMRLDGLHSSSNSIGVLNVEVEESHVIQFLQVLHLRQRVRRCEDV